MRARLVLPSLVLSAIVATPACAQPRSTSALRLVGNDPTRKVVGSGRMPDGWAVRFDPIVPRPGRPATAPAQATDVNVVVRDNALRFESGPAAIYYRASEPARGTFTVSATFSQPRSMAHEAYGLIVGGADLQRATERYLYFVVRPQDGGILVSRRTSDALPTALVPWTTDRAVQRESASDGRATNRLAIRVGRDSVWFVANGKVARALARSELGIATDGFVGVRVNHNLDLRVDDFRVEASR